VATVSSRLGLVFPPSSRLGSGPPAPRDAEEALRLTVEEQPGPEMGQVSGEQEVALAERVAEPGEPHQPACWQPTSVQQNQ